MLVIEGQLPDGTWQVVGRIKRGDPPGSMSDNQPEGRQLITFECRGDYSVISERGLGLDAEIPGGGRVIVALRDDSFPLATLGDGQTHTMTVQTDTRGKCTMRFTHVAGEASQP